MRTRGSLRLVYRVCAPTAGACHRRSRRLLPSTLTELNAIAAAATHGLSRMWKAGYSSPAASGIPSTL